MSFSPVVIGSGYGGWTFLKRTAAAQQKIMMRGSEVQREQQYFRDKIGSVATADDLLADRRLLPVALTAFGLEGDINNKAFLKKILEGGTLDASALANRLADKRYLEFSKTFGFGDYAQPSTKLSDFADQILAKYQARRFEAAVGEQDGNLRLALNAQRELGDLANRSISSNGKWYLILGSTPLRQVVQTAFGLPSSFSSLDIDRQLATLKELSERYLGFSDPAKFADSAQSEKLVQLFLTRAQISSSAAQSGQGTALSLLQGRASFSRYV